MKEILFILIAFMLCSVTAQAKKKISMKRVACITISVNQEEFETDDGVNYFVGEFCTFCERNGIAARVNNTIGTINRTTIRPSFGHSIYLATTGCWTHYYTNYCCPVKLKKQRNPSPKSYIYGLLRICYKK